MNRLILPLLALLIMIDVSVAENKTFSRDIKLTYKAYWGGFVISKVYSTIHLGPFDYKMTATYEITGLAAIFSKMKSKVTAEGEITADRRLKPHSYMSEGSWGSREGYQITTQFDPQTSKIISHDYSYNFKDKYTYDPVKEELKFGPDMVSFYLGLTLDNDAMNIGDDFKHQNVFGGFFLLDIAYRCKGRQEMKTRRSIYSGEVISCEFKDEIIEGRFNKIEKRKRKKKKKKKRSAIEPVPMEINYAYLDELKDLNVKVPVYSEFSIDWGKVRVYLTDIEVLDQSKNKVPENKVPENNLPENN